MNRIIKATTLIALLFAYHATPAQDVSVQPPTGLSSETYSASAVEIFWTRSEGAIAYVVMRDGVEVGTTDGNSFFEEGLSPRTIYQYEIRSIDASNTVTEGSSLITVTTRGGLPETDATRPLGLRADVYSSTALELFWQRDSLFRQGTFEIRRNGEVVALVPGGNSFFEEGLSPGTSYDYTVTLLESGAPPATITSTTNSESHVANDGNSGDAGDSTSPILENARLVIYSSTAAELLWDRPLVETGITRVEVLRDAESLGRINGTSYFDGERLPSIDYDYVLIARDNGGNELGRINLASSSAVPPESVQFVSPILGEFNEREIVNLAFATLSGQAFGRDLLRMPYYSDPVYAIPDLLDNSVNEPVAADITCSNGGTARFDPVATDIAGNSELNFSLDGCLDGTNLIDGELERSITDVLRIESPLGISVDGNTQDAAFSGRMDRQFRSRNNVELRTLVAEDLNFLFSDENGTYEVADGNFSYSFDFARPFTARMEGTFRVRSPLTANRFLEVSIDEPFEWRQGVSSTNTFFGNRVYFNSGRMTITAEDGSQFAVTAGLSESFLQINSVADGPSSVFFQWLSFDDSLPLFRVEF